MRTAGEKGHQWYCTALTPELCNTNLPSKMRSLVRAWHEVQYWNCHSWNVLQAHGCQGILPFYFSLIPAVSTLLVCLDDIGIPEQLFFFFATHLQLAPV